MGDRLLLQCHDAEEAGPVVYCHWSGGEARKIVERLRARMASRPNDLPYATARLVQEAINGDTTALSFGVWNAEKRLTAEDSHGDAGVVLIDVSQGFKVECLGGYLSVGEDGLPVEAHA